MKTINYNIYYMNKYIIELEVDENRRIYEVCPDGGCEEVSYYQPKNELDNVPVKIQRQTAKLINGIGR